MVNFYGGSGIRQAGQLTTIRPWGPRQTYIQTNNINVFDDCHGGHSCSGSGRMGGGFWTGFGITAGIAFLGNLLTGIFGRGGQQQVNNSFYQQGYMPGFMPGFMPGTDYASFNRYTQPGTTQTEESNNTLNNLRTFYSNYDWIYQDGKYYGRDKTSGELTEGFTSFEEITEKLKPSPSRHGDDITNITKTKEASAFNQNEQVSELGASIVPTDDGYELTYKDADGNDVKVQVETIAEAYEKLGIKPSVTQEVADPAGGKTGTSRGTTEPAKGVTSTRTETTEIEYPKLPEGFVWTKHNDKSFNEKTVDEVVDMLKKRGLNLTREELIVANPDAIKNGRVVDVTQLNLPSKSKYYDIISQLKLRGFTDIEIIEVKEGNDILGYTTKMKNIKGKEISYSTENSDYILSESTNYLPKSSTQKSQLPPEIENWNTQNPTKQITITSDGKYQTTVHTRTGNYTITGNSFDDLKAKAEAKVKRENSRQFNSGTGSYGKIY